MFRLFFVINFFIISFFLKIAIERLLKYFFSVFNVFKSLTSFFVFFSFFVSLLRIFFRQMFFLLLLLLLLLKYLYLNSKFFRKKNVFKWHFVILFHWCCRVFDNCEIKHWTYIICFFNSFHFFMSYWAHSRSDLMLCLFAIDAFMCDLYFVFIASICLVTFYTMIAFREIFAHFFDVIIFVAIKALNYYFFRENISAFFLLFFQEFFDDYFNFYWFFFWKLCFYY